MIATGQSSASVGTSNPAGPVGVSSPAAIGRQTASANGATRAPRAIVHRLARTLRGIVAQEGEHMVDPYLARALGY